jgi:hypothetical protein
MIGMFAGSRATPTFFQLLATGCSVLTKGEGYGKNDTAIVRVR